MSVAFLTALLLAYSGMLCLCLGLARHFRQVWNREPDASLSRLLRGLGWLALAASFWASVQAWGWAMGPVGWLGLLSMGGLILVLLLPYAARLSTLIAVAGWPLLGLGIIVRSLLSA